jgi:hypothetical protein
VPPLNVSSVSRVAGLSLSLSLSLSISHLSLTSLLSPTYLSIVVPSPSYARARALSLSRMDQAISFLAERGTAKHIEFSPLRAHDVVLPKGYSFLIASSGKHHSVQESQYSMRLVVCVCMYVCYCVCICVFVCLCVDWLGWRVSVSVYMLVVYCTHPLEYLVSVILSPSLSFSLSFVNIRTHNTHTLVICTHATHTLFPCSLCSLCSLSRS